MFTEAVMEAMEDMVDTDLVVKVSVVPASVVQVSEAMAVMVMGKLQIDRDFVSW